MSTSFIVPTVSLILFVVLSLVAWWLFRPEWGFFWRMRRQRKMTERIYREDALKHIHRCERYGHRVTVESLAGALEIETNKAATLMAELEAHNLIVRSGDSYQLSVDGRDTALHVIRAHRLWERYLADETGYEEEAWHERAEQAEHNLTPEQAEQLAAELGYPTHDPHGDPIPTAAGDMAPHGGQPLTSVPLDTAVRIVHLEDEPEAVFAQLVAEGLTPGMVTRVVEMSPQRIRFWANGEDHLLAPLVAANISVIPISPKSEEVETIGQRLSSQRLSSLQPGQQGEVTRISQASRGSERRRFLDLGILPGTVITAELTSPSGDPTAYRIRDALIALRQEQADLIQIKRINSDQP